MIPPNWSRISTEFPRITHDLWTIDHGLELRFNFLRGRYEVWHPVKGLVLRVETKAGDFVGPGHWIVETLSGRTAIPPHDSRHHADLEREAIGREEHAKQQRISDTGAVTPQSAGLIAATH